MSKSLISIIILLLAVSIITKNTSSQDTCNYLFFKISEYPVYLSDDIDTSQKEYCIVSLENTDTNNSHLDYFSDTWSKIYTVSYNMILVDSSITIKLINVAGNCADTMKILFKPNEMNTLYGVIENIYIEHISFVAGIYYLSFPLAVEQWNTVEHKRIGGLECRDITNFQDWMKVIENETENKRIKPIHYFNFRLYTSSGEIITNKTELFVINKLLLNTSYFDQGYFIGDFGFSFDSLNKCWSLFFKKNMYEEEVLSIIIEKRKNIVIDERRDIEKMSIGLCPIDIFYSKCSYSNIFLDNIIFQKGEFHLEIPPTIDRWKNMPTITLSGYIHSTFVDLTRYQSWIK